MNIMTSKYLFLALVISSFSMMDAITINNQNINEIVKPGEALSYENEANDNIAFKIENGNITIGKTKVYNADEIHNRFIEFCNGQHGTMEVKNLNIDAQFLNGQYITSKDNLIINVAKTFCVDETVLKANKIDLIVDQFDCETCFIDSDEFVIRARSAEALYALIHFTRNKNSTKPMVLSGSMNLSDGNTNEKMVIMLGASKVRILLSADAFK